MRLSDTLWPQFSIDFIINFMKLISYFPIFLTCHEYHDILVRCCMSTSPYFIHLANESFEVSPTPCWSKAVRHLAGSGNLQLSLMVFSKGTIHHKLIVSTCTCYSFPKLMSKNILFPSSKYFSPVFKNGKLNEWMAKQFQNDKNNSPLFLQRSM